MSIITTEITILTGALARDPELKYSADGKPMCRFSIASNRAKDAATVWYNVTAFGQTAERCHEYLHKGSAVQVEGIVGVDKQTGAPRVYEKDGAWRSSLDLLAHNVKFLAEFGKKEESPSAPVQDEIPF